MDTTKIDIFVGQSDGKGKIDAELTLPAEKNDVEKIYHITCNVNVREKTMEKDNIVLSGDVGFTVYYLDFHGQPDSFFASAPFTHSLESKSATPDNNISIRHRIDDLSAAVNDARTIKASATICFVAEISTSITLPELSHNGLQTKCVEITGITNSDSLSHTFNINEEIRIPGGMDKVSRIIGSECYGVINGIKKDGYNAICYGDLCITTLYSSEDAVWQIHECIPFEETIDCSCDTNNKNINATIIINKVTANAYDPDIISYGIASVITMDICDIVECPLVVDAYSLTHNIDTMTDHISILSDTTNEIIKYTMRITIPSEGIEHPVSIMATPYIKNEYSMDGTIIIDGNLVCNILYKDDSNQLHIHSQSIPLAETIPVSFATEDMHIWTKPEIQRVSSIISGDEMELRYMMDISVSAVRPTDLNIIQGVTEKDMLSRDNSSIMIYFRDDNEDIFDIAKAYHISVSDINNVNEHKLVLMNPCT